MAAPTLEWKDEWSEEGYEWPVLAAPEPAVVDQLGKEVIAIGGRSIKEAHADRGVVMSFPVNPNFPKGTRIRKQVPRCECRRRALLMMPLSPDSAPAPDTPPRDNSEPMKVCAVDDAVHMWPNANPLVK